MAILVRRRDTGNFLGNAGRWGTRVAAREFWHIHEALQWCRQSGVNDAMVVVERPPVEMLQFDPSAIGPARKTG